MHFQPQAQNRRNEQDSDRNAWLWTADGWDQQQQQQAHITLTIGTYNLSLTHIATVQANFTLCIYILITLVNPHFLLF